MEKEIINNEIKLQITEGIINTCCGTGHNKFNDETIKKWAISLVSTLQTSIDISKLKILVSHDGSSKELYALSKTFARVLSASGIETFLHSKNQPVTSSFALYVLKHTENFHILIHLGHYSQFENRKSLIFYKSNGYSFSLEQINEIKKNFDLTDSNIIKENEDKIFNLNTDLLLQEYTALLLSLRLRQNDNKLLKIGIIPTKANINVLTKIMGQLDFSYQFLEKEYIEKDNNLYILKHIKNFQDSYIVKFSDNNHKLSVYKHSSLNKFKKITDSNLISLVLNHIGLNRKNNINSKMFNNIIVSEFLNNQIYNYENKFFKNSFHIQQLMTQKDFDLINTPFIYFNEDSQFYSNIKYMQNFNASMLFVIVCEMLNYQITQNNNLDSILSNLEKTSNNENLFSFSININKEYLKKFINWITNLTSLFNQNIINKKSLINYKNLDEQFAFQLFFPNKQWLTIKFNKKENKLYFYVFTINNSFKIKTLQKYFENQISSFEENKKVSPLDKIKNAFFKK